MKVYDSITCSNEYAELPKWVAVDLTVKDEANIAFAKDLFDTNKDIRRVAFDLEGDYDYEGEQPVQAALLHVHRFAALSLELVHKYCANFVVNLDLESDVYEWDGKKVVEVDHEGTD